MVLESTGIILSRQRTTKVLIRLRWSAPLLFAYGIRRYSHDAAHLIKQLSFSNRHSFSLICSNCIVHLAYDIFTCFNFRVFVPILNYAIAPVLHESGWQGQSCNYWCYRYVQEDLEDEIKVFTRQLFNWHKISWWMKANQTIRIQCRHFRWTVNDIFYHKI